ncbi:DUF3515 family protein [Microbacterium sp.]|uniref:DUF3515 family protein n=1 Tax=Microbacterium sp. TaxID=51671 RepID=UPI0039E4C7E2
MSRVARALVGAVAAASVTGCATTVSLPTAKDANDPLCAEVTVRLPAEVAGQQRRWTDAQATGAWGPPGGDSSVILTCGVEPPGPTEARCITVGGVDWIVDDSQAPRYLVTSYGRTPAVEVFLDNEVVASNDVLTAFAPLVQQLPSDRACTSAASVLP